jgi:hypothetical protein
MPFVESGWWEPIPATFAAPTDFILPAMTTPFNSIIQPEIYTARSGRPLLPLARYSLYPNAVARSIV